MAGQDSVPSCEHRSVSSRPGEPWTIAVLEGWDDDEPQA